MWHVIPDQCQRPLESGDYLLGFDIGSGILHYYGYAEDVVPGDRGGLAAENGIQETSEHLESYTNPTLQRRTGIGTGQRRCGD
ncbi:MAG TPA: hypothetical protein VGJ47_02815 [Gemmatimonadaceae bacterium]